MSGGTHAAAGRWRLAGVLALALGFLAPATRGEANLVGNGTFDDDVSGWQQSIFDPDPPNGIDLELLWDAADAMDDPSSGSAVVVNQNTGITTAPMLEARCVRVTPGQPYDFGGNILIPDAQATTGFAAIRLAWYRDDLCLGPSFNQTQLTRAFTETGFWSFEEASVPAPDDALGARIGLVLRKFETTGALLAHFDDIFLVPEPGAAAGSLAALGALIAVSRSRRGRV